MSIYSKVRIKLTIVTVMVSLSIIIGGWLFLFTTDYIMFRNNVPMLFATTKVEEIKDERITVESGLGYYVILYGNGAKEFYLLNHKIK